MAVSDVGRTQNQLLRRIAKCELVRLTRWRPNGAVTGEVLLQRRLGRIDEDKKPLKQRGKRDATDCESKLESV